MKKIRLEEERGRQLQAELDKTFAEIAEMRRLIELHKSKQPPEEDDLSEMEE